MAVQGLQHMTLVSRDARRTLDFYTNDPDGTRFLVGEEASELGRRLQLPPWLEPHRRQIADILTPLVVQQEAAPAGGPR
jgi:catechol 2,3-dioxygenase-like lactoylglutathione lyase family enzyme